MFLHVQKQEPLRLHKSKKTHPVVERMISISFRRVKLLGRIEKGDHQIGEVTAIGGKSCQHIFRSSRNSREPLFFAELRSEDDPK